MVYESVNSQVYFIDDPIDPDWRIVRDVEPRSRRFMEETDAESLSAPGPVNATMNAGVHRGEAPSLSAEDTEPILPVDVEHVLAHEESDDDAPYADLDHTDDIIFEAENEDAIGIETESQRVVGNFWDDL